MNEDSQHVKPEEEGRFRTRLIIFVGIIMVYALYEALHAMLFIPMHPLRLILIACVFADVVLMARCAFLFKTRPHPNTAGLALLTLSGPILLTAQTVARTGNVFHMEDAVFIIVPLALLYGLYNIRADVL